MWLDLVMMIIQHKRHSCYCLYSHSDQGVVAGYGNNLISLREVLRYSFGVTFFIILVGYLNNCIEGFLLVRVVRGLYPIYDLWVISLSATTVITVMVRHNISGLS